MNEPNVPTPVDAPDQITLSRVDPVLDASLIHSWVREDRAEFWGMREKSVEEVSEIYTWIDEQDHLSAQLASWAGAPWALVQTYDPFVDEIGEFYDRRPGDLGMHLLLAPGPRPPGFTGALLAHLPKWVFSDPRNQRVVLEPDVRNSKSIAVLDRVGAERALTVDLPGKTAQFAFLTREDWVRTQL